MLQNLSQIPNRHLLPFYLCGKAKPKIDALKRGLAENGLTPTVTSKSHPSGVNEQPYGHEETLRGASNRAWGVRKMLLGENIIGWAAAIENGVMPHLAGHIDLAYVYLISPEGLITIGRSAAVWVPEELVVLARASGWAKTCGQFEADRTPGLDNGDPHVKWSRNGTSRTEILTSAVIEGLHEALITWEIL